MFAIICAIALSLGILIKLLDVTAIVPILLLIVARLWLIRHETSFNIRANLLPMAAGFHDWVADHFYRVPVDDDSVEIWTR